MEKKRLINVINVPGKTVQHREDSGGNMLDGRAIPFRVFRVATVGRLAVGRLAVGAASGTERQCHPTAVRVGRISYGSVVRDPPSPIK